MKVLVAAGASGGHVYPGLATAEELRSRGHDVAFVGGDRIEARIVPEAGFPFHELVVRRPPSVRAELLTPRGIRSVLSIAAATARAKGLLRRLRPDVVLGMGGFASVPVALAAAWAGKNGPALVLHEQNAHLSLAQRITLRRCDVLATGLPIEEDVAHPRIVHVGNPVRAKIAALAGSGAGERATPDDARRAARTRLGLDPHRPTVLVLGGSLGSGPLNAILPTVRLPRGVQVLHLCGAQHEAATRDAWASSPDVHVVVMGFLDAIEDAYLSADVAVSRSGASAVAELAIAGLPSILVPLPTLARGDQAANARVLERAGAAVVIEQSVERIAQRIGDEVERILSDASVRASMRSSARSVARPDAARRLAGVVESVLGSG